MGRLRAVAPVCLLVVLLSAEASASGGRFPASNEIVFSPSDASRVVVRTTFAILPSNDDGATWSYLCLGSLGVTPAGYETPELAFTANGTLIAGMNRPMTGLDRSTDVGCNWSCAGGPLAGQPIVDTAVRPDAPHHIVALASLASSSVDGGYQTQAFESSDDGATWSALGPPLDPAVSVTGVEVSRSDDTRLYISGTRGYRAARTASLFTWTETDGPAEWIEHPIPMFSGDTPGGEASIYLGGVDPTDPDRVYLRSAANFQSGVSRLYVTTDDGATFQALMSFPVDGGNYESLTGELLGFALSPDGSKVFVGTMETGLWRASRTDLVFSQVNPGVGVQCLATRQTASGPELWACGNEYRSPPGSPDNFIVGRSMDDGLTFEARLPTLTTLAGLAQCTSAPGSMACGVVSATSCSCAEYQSFCADTETNNACQGCGMGGDDAGPADSGASVADHADGGNAVSLRKGGACGCSAVGARAGHGTGLALGLALAAFCVRRRRRTAIQSTAPTRL